MVSRADRRGGAAISRGSLPAVMNRGRRTGMIMVAALGLTGVACVVAGALLLHVAGLLG